MTNSNRRTEEKGQRTPRSLDTYEERGGIKGDAYCSCGALYRNKRWLCAPGETEKSKGQTIVCPACRRVADHNPAGILFLSGDFYAAHAEEIRHLIDNITRAAVAKNPLGRVMEFNKEKNGLAITTTDVKLAQKIGREIFRSHGGELHYVWSHAESPVRVTWSR